MEYNGTKFTFLDTVGKKFVGMVQKANQIIGIIDGQDAYPFNFTDAVARFKERSWELDGFVRTKHYRSICSTRIR